MAVLRICPSLRRHSGAEAPVHVTCRTGWSHGHCLGNAVLRISFVERGEALSAPKSYASSSIGFQTSASLASMRASEQLFRQSYPILGRYINRNNLASILNAKRIHVGLSNG
jgi:hypothetical protein